MNPAVAVGIIGIVVLLAILVVSIGLDDVHGHVLELERILKNRQEIAAGEAEISSISHDAKHRMLDVTLGHLTGRRYQ